MEKWSNCVAVVTGASSGIGAAISKKLVEHGLVVIGLARRVERLQQFEQSWQLASSHTGKFIGYQCDVTSEDNVKKAFEEIDQKYGPIAVLINNAGITRKGKLMDGPMDQLRAVIETNLTAVCTSTIAALESMKKFRLNGDEKPFGHIININSILGHSTPQIPSSLNVYPSTKHAITAYTEVLRQELRNSNTNIRVTSLSPGFVQTEILSASNADQKEVEEFLAQKPPILQPEDIADAVIYVLGTPKHVQIHELMIKPVGEFF